MSTHISKRIPWDAPDVIGQLQTLVSERDAALIQARRALMAQLPPELHRVTYEVLDMTQEIEWLIGALFSLRRIVREEREAADLTARITKLEKARASQDAIITGLRQKVREQRGHLSMLASAATRKEYGRNLDSENRRLAAENDALRAELDRVRRERVTVSKHVVDSAVRDARTAENIRANRLERQARDLQTELEITRGAPAGLALIAAAPTPAPRTRRPRDQVVTDTPFGVDAVARDVEDFVRRQGRCSKVDVSAAFPHARAYLSAAYRHLHASRRVHVDGYTLKPWPHPIKEAR